jgi:hypothetical protein
MDISIKSSAVRQKGIKGLAKAGLTAKGFVYLILGAFALMAALNIGGQSAAAADKSHIFSFLDESFAGKWLLPVLAIGLICYCIWRSIEGIHAIQTGDKKHYGKAVRYFASAGIYLFIAVSAAKIFLHKPVKNGDEKQELASQLLSQPFGHWLAAAAAIAFSAVGIYQLYYAWSEKYKKHTQRMNRQTNAAPILLAMGKIGYTARGFVWLIIAYLMSRAAFTGRAQDAGDTGKAFSFIEKSSAGSLWLGAIAIGLIAYGIFSFVRARYENFLQE